MTPYIDLSKVPDQYKKNDDNTIVHYSVKAETIDIGMLKIEKRAIKEQLAKILSDEELLRWARENYTGNNIDIERLEARLKQIDQLLEIE